MYSPFGRLIRATILCAMAFGAVLPPYVAAQGVDVTPPTCVTAGHTANSETIRFEDDGSGIASITVLESANATVTVPSFSSGTTDAIDVTASPTSTGQASFRVKATDVAGNQTDCGRFTIKPETATKNSPIQDSLTGIQQSQYNLTFFNGTPGFSRIRIVIGRTRIRQSLNDGDVFGRNLSGDLVSGSNTIDVTLGGHTGDTGLLVLHGDPTSIVACPAAPTKTFAGGPSTGACRQFDGDQTSCENAYHLTGSNVGPATCYYDTNDDTCRGCGPANHDAGNCTNGCFPPSDPCAAPGTIPPGGGIVTGSISGVNGGATGTCASTAGPEAAFAWTPSFTGMAFLTTCNDVGATNFDTVLYVREATCDTGTEVACSDSSDNCGSHAALTLSVTSGTTYYVFVDGLSGQAGDFRLTVLPLVCTGDPSRTTFAGGAPFGSNSVCGQYSGDQASCEDAFHFTFQNYPAACEYDTNTDSCFGCGPGVLVGNRSFTCATNVCLPPATDPCTSPTSIPAEGGTFSGSFGPGNSGAAGSCGFSGGAPEVAYSWTPSTSGVATIDTCDDATNFDTVVYIREADCATGTESDCNDDSGCGGNRSAISPTVTAGTTYYIFVDGYWGAFGDFKVNVTPPAP